MPRMPDLAMVEGCDPHEDSTPDWHIDLAAGVETPRYLERPMSGGPARRAAHVGTIARETAGDDHAGNDGRDRNQPVHFRRVRHALCLRHEPARAIALADIGI